jgi:hypothetical protein
MAPASRAIVQQRRIFIPGFAHFPQQPGWRPEPRPVPVPVPIPTASLAPLMSNHSIILYYHSSAARRRRPFITNKKSTFSNNR